MPNNRPKKTTKNNKKPKTGKKIKKQPDNITFCLIYPSEHIKKRRN
jgi:hypothetical protein